MRKQNDLGPAPVPAPRSTRQQRAVEAALAREGRPLAPAEILAMVASTVPKISLTTVYRVLRRLLDAGAAVAVGLPGQPSRYEVAGKGHHHHFLCRLCDRTYEVPGCREDFAHQAPAGFAVEAHDLWLTGCCGPCRARGRQG